MREFIDKDKFWIDLQVQTPLSIAIRRNAITEQEIVKPYLEKIRAEIEKQEKWLLQAGCNTYNVDIAFSSIKSVLAESEGKK